MGETHTEPRTRTHTGNRMWCLLHFDKLKKHLAFELLFKIWIDNRLSRTGFSPGCGLLWWPVRPVPTAPTGSCGPVAGRSRRGSTSTGWSWWQRPADTAATQHMVRDFRERAEISKGREAGGKTPAGEGRRWRRSGRSSAPGSAWCAGRSSLWCCFPEVEDSNSSVTLRETRRQGDKNHPKNTSI